MAIHWQGEGKVERPGSVAILLGILQSRMIWEWWRNASFTKRALFSCSFQPPRSTIRSSPLVSLCCRVQLGGILGTRTISTLKAVGASAFPGLEDHTCAVLDHWIKSQTCPTSEMEL